MAATNTIATQSLNTDPFNVRAEELALEDCARGLEVRRTWSECEMVRSFDGRLFPGTPDGMFETWDGALTCVQVVRVPLVAELSVAGMQQTLAHTVLVKVVKSQQWLRASHFAPKDFVIFCWLPFCVPSEVALHAEEKMQQVREVDPRFSLRLRVPAEPGALFPARFASNHDVEAQRARGGYSWSDVATYNPSDTALEEEEEEGCEWDITWGWEDDWCAAAEGQASEAEEAGQEHDEEADFEWDITWDWAVDGARGRDPSAGTVEGEEDVCMLSGSSAMGERMVWDDKG